jgi:hypothetical protein
MKRFVAGVVAVSAVAGTVMLVGSPAEAAKAPICKNADLKASFKATGAGMSHVEGRMTLKNVSGHRCRTGGFGGLSYVGHGNGTQIGRPATRAPGGKVHEFVLRPGQRAVSKVLMTTTAPYGKRYCRPTKIDGFRVYVPNSYVSQFVPYQAKVCANRKIKQLSHRAYQPA